MKYLDKEQSTIMKGILILLVIVGHNNILFPVNSSFWNWIYTFHRACFFILPFFYDWKMKDEKLFYISKLITRNWIPYLITGLMVLIVSLYTKSVSEMSMNTILAFLNGSSDACEKYLGGRFLWFLPSFCTFSILLLFSRKSNVFSWLITVIGLFLWFLNDNVNEKIEEYALFGLPMALKYYALGFISKCLYGKMVIYNINPYKICPIVFLVLSVLMMMNVGSYPFYKMIMPIFAFYFVRLLAVHIKSNFLLFIGKNSLAIYLLHLFVYNALMRFLGYRLLGGVVNLIGTIVIAMLLAYIISKNSILRKLYLPKDLKEFLNFYK